MNEKTAIEFTKIQILVIAGVATGLQIGLFPNPYYFGVALGLLMLTTTSCLISLIKTDDEFPEYARNATIYMIITAFLLLGWGFVTGAMLDLPQTRNDFIFMILMPFIIAIFIIGQRYGIYEPPEAEVGDVRINPFKRCVGEDGTEIILYMLNLTWICGATAWLFWS